MEIEQLRQEINDLLGNVVEHSNSYTAKEHLSSLDASFILKKVNKVQESLTVLKYLLEVKHDKRSESKIVETFSEVEEVISEEAVLEMPVVSEERNSDNSEEELPVMDSEESIVPEIKEKIIVETEKVVKPTVTKLTDRLTLNDRYLFANELCAKDMNAFNELVKSIDNCGSLDEATKLYSTMAWEIGNEHVETFTDLVERRFS